MGELKFLIPSDEFKHVAENAVKELEVGIVIGYDKNGEFMLVV